MTDRLTKIMGLFDLFYRAIVLNTLFLLSNCLLFQVIFFLDFKVGFFPVYLLTSFTVIPSLIASIRTAHALYGEQTAGIFKIFLNQLWVTVTKEIRLSVLLTFSFYLTLTVLYVSQVTGSVTYILYIMNIVFLVFELIFAINMIRESIFCTEQKLLRQVLTTYTPNFLKNLFLLTTMIMSIHVSFQLTYTLIIIVFGAVILGLHRLILTHRKDTNTYGVSD